jgi:hypothetical protein
MFIPISLSPWLWFQIVVEKHRWWFTAAFRSLIFNIRAQGWAMDRINSNTWSIQSLSQCLWALGLWLSAQLTFELFWIILSSLLLPLFLVERIANSVTLGAGWDELQVDHAATRLAFSTSARWTGRPHYSDHMPIGSVATVFAVLWTATRPMFQAQSSSSFALFQRSLVYIRILFLRFDRSFWAFFPHR